jgi:hypothetical protein
VLSAYPSTGPKDGEDDKAVIHWGEDLLAQFLGEELGPIPGQRSSGLPAVLGRWRLILMGFVLVAALAAALVFWRKRRPPVA